MRSRLIAALGAAAVLGAVGLAATMAGASPAAAAGPAASTVVITPTGAPTPVATTTPAGPCLRVTLDAVNVWQNGAVYLITIINCGTTAVSSWRLELTLDNCQSIIGLQVWNGTASVTGCTITLTNAPFNGYIPAGGMVSAGFMVVSSTPVRMAKCRINGLPCGPEDQPTLA